MPVTECAALPPEQAAKLARRAGRDEAAADLEQAGGRVAGGDRPVLGRAGTEGRVVRPADGEAGLGVVDRDVDGRRGGESPAASNAVAVTVAAPSATVVVSKLAVKGAEVSVATTTPRTLNSTRSTPTLSDAVGLERQSCRRPGRRRASRARRMGCRRRGRRRSWTGCAASRSQQVARLRRRRRRSSGRRRSRAPGPRTRGEGRDVDAGRLAVRVAVLLVGVGLGAVAGRAAVADGAAAV